MASGDSAVRVRTRLASRTESPGKDVRSSYKRTTCRVSASAGALPTSATFNGAAVSVTAGAAAVTGDGTLVFDDGGTLEIARGKPTAKAFVKLR